MLALYKSNYVYFIDAFVILWYTFEKIDEQISFVRRWERKKSTVKRIVICMLAVMVALAGCGKTATTSAEVPSQQVSETLTETDAYLAAQNEIADEIKADPQAAMEDLKGIPDEYSPLDQTAESGYDVTARMGHYIEESDNIKSSGGSQIDVGNVSSGYVRVAQSGSNSRLKVQVIKGDKTYNYDLNTNGDFEVFPLQSGDGKYTIRIMKNVDGNKYTQVFSQTVKVKLESELEPFLCPSQYVNYNADSAAVKQAEEVCSGLKGDIEKVAAVYKWIIDNITYDLVKAQTVQSGYLPDLDSILSSGEGICFDYAALMAAMLRSQGVATKLICGTVSAADLNHAWNEVYLEGTGWVTVKLYFSGNAWERMDPTFAASGNSNIEQYIGDASNYTGLRVY